MAKKAKVQKSQKAPISAGMMETSKRIRQFRESIELSRSKFSDALGVPPTTLKNYELNYRTTGSEFLVAVGRVYGVQVMLWMMGFPSTYELPTDNRKHG